jgi:small redox-active disulfide protein 2
VKIQVLGTGCARCDNLYSNAVDAVARIESIAKTTEVEKVKDPEEFFRMKVAVTPALVIENEVISTGKVLSPDEIEAELLKRSGGDAQ